MLWNLQSLVEEQVMKVQVFRGYWGIIIPTGVTRERNAFEKLALGLADMLTDNSDSKPQDRISTEINKQGEDKVDTVAEIINDFVNSFDTDDKDTIYFISSGAPASWDLKNDVLRAKTKTELIQSRLEKEDKFWFNLWSF